MSISLTRLARRRLLHQRGLAAALGAGLAAALGLSATVLGVQAVTTEAGLRHALAGIPDGGLITIQSTGPQAAAAFDAFESDADRRVTGALGGSARPVAAFATLSAAVAWTVNNERFSAEPSSVNPNPPKPALAYSEDLARHVRVTQGALPPDAATTGDHPIAVSTDQPFGLRLGDRVCLGFVGGPSDPTRVGVYPLCLRVAALWQALDPHEPYWQDRFPAWELMASRADLFAGLAATNRAGRITTVLATTGLLYQIPPGSIDASSAPGIANGLHMLHGYYSVSADSLFATQVDATIDAFEQRQQLGAYTIQLVAAALVLLALFAVS